MLRALASGGASTAVTRVAEDTQYALALAYALDFAGELVAYAVPSAGQPFGDEPRKLVVKEWRTGRGSVRLRLLPAEASDLTATPRVRFAIPAGARRRLVLRVNRRAYAIARQEAGDDSGAFFDVRATAVDPAGRRSRLSDGYGVNVRPYY